MEQLSNTDLNNTQMTDIDLTTKAIPDQVKKNEAVEAIFPSTTVTPDGARNGYGTNGLRDITHKIANSDLTDLTTAELVGQIKVTGMPKNGAGVPVDVTDLKFVGAHTLLNSLGMLMYNKPLINIQKDADILADISLKCQSTDGELKKMKSKMLLDEPMTKNTVYDFRLPLKLLGRIQNLIPTNAISTPLEINCSFNTDFKRMFYSPTAVTFTNAAFSLDDLHLEVDFVRITPLLYKKYIQLISGNNGIILPFNTYAIEKRTLQAIPGFNFNLSANYINLISLLQAPYNNVANGQVNFYENVKFNADSLSKASNYLVNFDSSTYFNLNGNKGTKGKASFAEALDRVISTFETNQKDSGATLVENIDNNQILSVSFLKSKDSTSPFVSNSGVNGNRMNGRLDCAINFDSNITANKSLYSIMKYTRRIVFRNGQLDVLS